MARRRFFPLMRGLSKNGEDRYIHNCNEICEKNYTSNLLLCKNLAQNIWLKTVTAYLLMSVDWHFGLGLAGGSSADLTWGHSVVAVIW